MFKGKAALNKLGVHRLITNNHAHKHNPILIFLTVQSLMQTTIKLMAFIQFWKILSTPALGQLMVSVAGGVRR